MALLYRSPVEEVIARFTSEEQSRISSTAIRSIQKKEEEVDNLFNFSVSEKAKEKLLKAGLYLSPYCYRTHSHPVCKMLENYLLYEVLPNFLDNSFIFVGIKNFKLNFLKQRFKNLSLIKLINRYVTSLDKVRYSSDFVVINSKADEHFAAQSGFQDDVSLRDLIPACLVDKGKKIFLHDEIHYWSINSLISFLEAVKPEVLLATLVYPPEILAGAKESLNPWAYEFEVRGDSLVFAPDGCWQEAYEQPISGGFLLQANSIELPDGTIFSVDLVHQKFSHSLISITRGSLVKQKNRFFSNFEAISLKELYPLTNRVSRCYPVSENLVKKVYMYLRTLKKPDLESAEAKIRQLISEPSGREIKFLEDFAKLVLLCSRDQTIILSSNLKRFKNFFIQFFPSFLSRLSKSFQSQCLEDFIYNLEAFRFEIETKVFRKGSYFSILFSDVPLINPEIDVTTIFEDKWSSCVDTHKMLSSPYVGSIDNQNQAGRSGRPLSIHNFALACWYYICNHDKVITPIAENSFEEFTRSVLIMIGRGKAIDVVLKEIGVNAANKAIYSLKFKKQQYLLKTFSVSGSKWFLLLERVNVRFLQSCEHKATVNKDFIKSFSRVIDDVVGRKFCLNKVFREVQVFQDSSTSDHSDSSSDSESESHIEEEESDTDSLDGSKGAETPNTNSLALPCGLVVTIKKDHRLDKFKNFFSFSDPLKGRSASFFSKKGITKSAYDGGSHLSQGWHPALDEILDICGFPGLFNSCLAQKYDGKSNLPMRSDDENVYEEGHQVLMVNLTGTALFQISGKGLKRKGAITSHCGKCSLDNKKDFDVEDHCFFLMPRGFQETHKYGASKNSCGRVSLTFRMQKVEDDNLPSQKAVLNCDSLKGSLEPSVWSEGLKQIQGFISRIGSPFRFDLCNCFNCGKRKKIEFIADAICKTTCSEGLTAFDHALITHGRQAMADIAKFHSKIFAVLCLLGSMEVNASDVSVSLMKNEFSEFVSSITAASPDSLCIILCRLDQRKIGNLRIHNNDCVFSGNEVKILGCPSVTLNNLDPNDFNIFRVPGDGNCFWYSIGYLLGTDGLLVKDAVQSYIDAHEINDAKLADQMKKGSWAEIEATSVAALALEVRFEVIIPAYEINMQIGESQSKFIGFMILNNCHYQPCVPKNGCLIRAIAEAIGRSETDVLSFLCKPKTRHIFDDLCLGLGVNFMYLSEVFEHFDVQAHCDFGDRIEVLNPTGKIKALFEVSQDHIEVVEKLARKVTSTRFDALRSVKQSALEILKANGSIIKYFPSVKRATIIQESLLGGFTGVISDSKFHDQERWIEDHAELDVSERVICAILGTFGSGKSFLFKHFMQASAGKFVTFVSPRKALADEVKRDLGIGGKVKEKGSQGWDVVTFETFLKRINGLKEEHVIIFDEVQLFPPGYLDLCLLKIRKSCFIAVAGDPCQSTYDSQKDRSILGSLGQDILEILKGQSYRYNIESRRFRNPNFVGKLPCLFKEGTLTLPREDVFLGNSLRSFVMSMQIKPEVVLVSSFEEKKIVQSYFGSSQNCLTFGESTGLNFDKGVILITQDSFWADDRRWLTALSRFSNNIAIINISGVSNDGILQQFSGKPLYHFLTNSSGESVIRDLLPGEPTFFRGFSVRIGAAEGVKEDKLQGDPWLKTMIFLGQTPDEEIEESIVEFQNDEWFKTHVAISSIEGVRARWVGKFLAKEAREVRCGSDVTQQFTDESRTFGRSIANQSELFEAIYPRHKGTDSITFLMAVRKRLSFSRPDVESAKLRRAKQFSKFLLDEFLKFVPLRQNHDKFMMETSVLEFEEKKVSKSSATIENHSGRSCRDWLADIALIFMKSQHCTKFDNRFRVAKAGQTLACFQHSVLVRFAPYMRYIEKKLLEVLPHNFYIHSGKGLDELNQWIKDHDFSGVCTESDYEAFDASQDHFILAFEVAVMHHLGIPEDLILDYEFIKTHLGSKLGNFSIMRFTGEASTFLFNTMANMLFTFLRYDLNGSEAIAFAGDDMCANQRLKVTQRNESFLKKIRLKAKVQYVNSPTFCGWCLFKHGIFKRPQLVLERIYIALEMNNIENCIDNYALEVAYAYQLGELAAEVMSEEELESHYNCVRFIVKNKHLLKSSARETFESL